MEVADPSHERQQDHTDSRLLLHFASPSALLVEKVSPVCEFHDKDNSAVVFKRTILRHVRRIIEMLSQQTGKQV